MPYREAEHFYSAGVTDCIKESVEDDLPLRHRRRIYLFTIMATELEYNDLLRYKTDKGGRYRHGLTENEKRNIWEKAARYIVECQQLYIVDKDKELGTDKKRRVIFEEEEKKKILTMCHSGIDGMHFGRDKTYFKVRNLFMLVI